MEGMSSELSCAFFSDLVIFLGRVLMRFETIYHRKMSSAVEQTRIISIQGEGDGLVQQFQSFCRCFLYDKIVVILGEIIVTQCTERALRGIFAGRGSANNSLFVIIRLISMNNYILEEIPQLVLSNFLGVFMIGLHENRSTLNYSD
jgi:hypothetical protein